MSPTSCTGLILLLFLDVSLSAERYLGKFEIVMHGVQGGLFSLGHRRLRAHRFYYDGEGPPGVRLVVLPVGVGTAKADYHKGIPVNSIDELEPGESALDLPAIYNRNLTFDIPNGLKASEVSLVILWCPEYEVSFGRVDLEEASSSSPAVPPPPLTYVGPFVETEHAVAGDVYVRDARTLVVRNFNYDGRGPSVVFFAGEEDSLDTGVVVQYPYRRFVGLFGPEKLRRIVRRDIELRLPDKLDARRLRWLSVWCDTFEVSFGHVLFPKNEK